MAKVKICGITNIEDALAAAAAGADSIGFNFYRKSPRFVTSETAAAICKSLPKSVEKIGVFVNSAEDEVLSIAQFVGLDAVQLHGDESPEYVSNLRKRFGNPIIKAFRVGPDFEPSIISHFEADAVLLDAFSPAEHGGTGDQFDWNIARKVRETVKRLYLAGGLGPDNVAEAVRLIRPYAVDACSRLESAKGKKDNGMVAEFIANARSINMDHEPDENGYWGEFGGRFVPETLVAPLDDLTAAYRSIENDTEFLSELNSLLKDFVGRPSPLYFARRMTEKLGGGKIYLKREDLNHTGAHKINNCLGQVLLAIRMGKRRIIAETGAGQHGVATATVCARFGLECVVYMGTEDMRRQELNVYRMKLLGAEVRGVDSGSRTLKDAINEALRDWVTNVDSTYYLLGSALGPHPYPLMVRNFQRIIGMEAREQILEKEGRLPASVIACVGGGSNSIGIFHEFLSDPVRLVGVEAGGKGPELGQHAARFLNGGTGIGILQGTKSYVLQDQAGQIAATHSVSAGLDYASVGPEHAFLRDEGRVEYFTVTDTEALDAFRFLASVEGIIPALESSHAVAYAMKSAPGMKLDDLLLVNLSGRGDKDVNTVSDLDTSRKD